MPRFLFPSPFPDACAAQSPPGADFCISVEPMAELAMLTLSTALIPLRGSTGARGNQHYQNSLTALGKRTHERPKRTLRKKATRITSLLVHHLPHVTFRIRWKLTQNTPTPSNKTVHPDAHEHFSETQNSLACFTLMRNPSPPDSCTTGTWSERRRYERAPRLHCSWNSWNTSLRRGFTGKWGRKFLELWRYPYKIKSISCTVYAESTCFVEVAILALKNGCSDWYEIINDPLLNSFVWGCVLLGTHFAALLSFDWFSE